MANPKMFDRAFSDSVISIKCEEFVRKRNVSIVGTVGLVGRPIRFNAAAVNVMDLR